MERSQWLLGEESRQSSAENFLAVTPCAHLLHPHLTLQHPLGVFLKNVHVQPCLGKPWAESGRPLRGMGGGGTHTGSLCWTDGSLKLSQSGSRATTFPRTFTPIQQAL